MRAERKIVSALFAAEGYSLPGRNTQQNCHVTRGILRVDIRSDEGKRIVLSDLSGREMGDISLQLINPDP